MKTTAFNIRLVLDLFVVAALVAGFAGQTSAQRTEADGATYDRSNPLAYGVRANLNIAGFYGSAVEGSTTDARLGGGAYLNYRLRSYFAVQPEIHYSGRAAQTRVLPAGREIRSVAVQSSYLDIPLLFRGYLPEQDGVAPHLSVGPFYSHRLSSEVRHPNAGFVDFDPDEVIRSNDYGIILGGGLDGFGTRNSISLDFRYMLGLANLIETDEQPEFRNRGLVFSVGVGF